MITVTDTSDSGAGTLRQAIADAALGEEIQFAVVGTIDLQSELVIAQDLVITGPGAAVLTIDRDGGAGNLRLLNVTGGLVSISGLTFSDGDPGAGNGGAILIGAGGDLTLNNCVIQNSTTTGSGGGIYNLHNLTMNDCTVDNCSVTGSGGGLWSNSIANLTSCTFTNNQSATAGGAIRNSGVMDLTKCVIGSVGSDNRCVGAGIGGGIYTETTLTAVDTVFDGNRSAATCSSVFNTGTMYMLRGDINQSLGAFPALMNQGTVALEDVTIMDNAGSAFYNDSGSAYLARITFNNNPQGGIGNCITNNLGSLFMDTCTVSGNGGTGIVNTLGSVDLRHSTVTNNGGGFSGAPGSDQTFENDIISGSTTADDLSVDDVDTTSLGHNIYGTMTNPITLGPGDQVVVGFANLRLGPLANNGGYTFTHALLAGSPAIDAGNTAGGLPNGGWTFPDPRFQDYTAVPPTYDQRLASRVSGAAIDIGAFEFASAPTPPVPVPPVQQLIAQVQCFSCYGLTMGDALELVLLMTIVRRLDPDMNLTPQSLLDQGQCFACLGLDTGTVIKLVLLTLIANLLEGGVGVPQCILCGPGDPVTDPDPCNCAWYINLTNSTTWYWDDPHNQWYQFG